MRKKTILIIVFQLISFFLISLYPCLAYYDGAEGTEDEMALYDLISANKFVTAKELSGKILIANPNSFAGLFGLGVIYHRAEGNLPKAYFYLKAAKKNYERIHGNGEYTTDNKTWRWHCDILYELITTTSDMDLNKEVLIYLEAYDKSYTPKQTAYYSWPLMKLGREKEARQKIQEALDKSFDTHNKIVALNTLGALEGDLDNRDEAYRIFKELKQKVDSLNDGYTYVYVVRNFGLMAEILLKYDEAESAYLDAAKYGSGPGETSNPWEDIVNLYVPEGRLDEAFQALRKMIIWGLARDPYLDQQCISSEQATKAGFLLATGYPDLAYLITKQLISMPDRLGYTSSRKYQSLGGLYFMHYEALKNKTRLLKEKLPSLTLKEKFKVLYNIFKLELEKIFIKLKIRSIVLNNNALKPTLIPHHFQGINISVYRMPDILDIIAPGLIESEIIKIRQSYKYKELSEPYLKELEGELYYKWHMYGKSKQMLLDASKNLIASEKLLHARIWALLGNIEENNGNYDEAISLFYKAYQVYPAIFRHLDIKLPIIVNSPGDPTSAKIEKFIYKSPAFKKRDGAFQLQLSNMGRKLYGILLDPQGNTITSVSSQLTGDPVKDSKLFMDELYLKIFSSVINASFVDINSLDGSTLQAEETRKDLKDFFFEKEKPEN